MLNERGVICRHVPKCACLSLQGCLIQWWTHWRLSSEGEIERAAASIYIQRDGDVDFKGRGHGAGLLGQTCHSLGQVQRRTAPYVAGAPTAFSWRPGPVGPSAFWPCSIRTETRQGTRWRFPPYGITMKISRTFGISGRASESCGCLVWRSTGKTSHADGQWRRVSLPTYPFERQKYWIGNGTCARCESCQTPQTEFSVQKDPDISRWFYVPSWRRLLPKTGWRA